MPRSISAAALSINALLLLLSLCAASGPAASEPAGRYIIQYQPGAQDALTIELQRRAIKALQQLSRHNAVAVQLTAQDVRALLSHLAITNIEPDPRRYRLAQTMPYGVAQIQTEPLSPFGTPRKVCIIDSGYDLEHPDLPKGDRVTGETQNGRWDQPGDSHGTHVAGTIAAVDNNQGVVGVHPGVGLSLHIVRVFADKALWVYSSDVVAALDACSDAGAHVVSLSLGGSEPSSVEQRAFATNFENDALAVAAAGNAGTTTCSYPACYDSVISVAATDQSKRAAPFSQSNPQVELSAPGVDILSTVVGGGIGAFSGTSMATPQVSGAAALLWSLHDQCSNSAIRQALAMSAEDLGQPGRDPDYGYGLVQVGAADHLLSANGCKVTGDRITRIEVQ